MSAPDGSDLLSSLPQDVLAWEALVPPEDEERACQVSLTKQGLQLPGLLAPPAQTNWLPVLVVATALV